MQILGFLCRRQLNSTVIVVRYSRNLLSIPPINQLNHPMKFSKLTFGFAGIAALASFSTAIAADADLCTPVQASVTKAVSAAPESVLKVVAEQVAASPKCACEIVKAAIGAAKADSATVVAIVEAAATAAPDQLPVVLACAASASPQAAAALADKFGADTEGSGKDVVGKEPVGKAPVDKGPVPVVEEEFSDDFGFIRPGVGGIYLTIPNGSRAGEAFGSGFSDEEIQRLLRTGKYELVNGQLVRVITTTVTKRGRPIIVPQPVTNNQPN
jgi:hypothetical protein